MDTSGHRYVKPVTVTTGPVRLAVVIPSPRLARKQTSKVTRHLAGDLAWVAFVRRRGAVWSPPEVRDGLTPDQLWSWIDTKTYDKSRLWVVSPSASHMLTLMGFWPHVEAGRYAVFQRADDPDAPVNPKTGKPRSWVGRLVLRDRPCIVTARKGRASMTFVSMTNYTNSPLEDLAKYTDLDAKYPAPPRAASGDPRYGVEATREIVLRTLQALVSEWIDGECGPWGETAGKLVLSLWRRKFYTRKVCRHCDDQAGELEQAAMHGGRASVWFFGDAGDRAKMPAGRFQAPEESRWAAVPGPVHRLDVTSMYPSLLRDRYFPVRLINWKEGITPDQLAALAEHRGVIATVTADVSSPEYPFRSPRKVTYRWPGEGCRSRRRRIEHPARTLYPLGQVTLSLAGPELLRLHAEGGIVKVHRAAVYDMGRPFVGLMNYLLEQRDAAKGRGDGFLYSLYKSWAVSFGGKFAQSGTRWTPRPEITPPIRWGEWRDKDAPSGETTFWRAFAGLSSVRETGRPGAALLAAVFAYLTSYGRLLMRDVRSGLPARTVLSQDTDGIWTTDAGLACSGIARTPGPSSPGTLRLVGSHQFARWYTPKHYYTDGAWTLAGIADGFGVARNNEVEWRTLSNPAHGTPRAAPTILQETVQRVRLDMIGPSEFLGADGWAIPPEVRYGRVKPQGGHDPAPKGVDGTPVLGGW